MFLFDIEKELFCFVLFYALVASIRLKWIHTFNFRILLFSQGKITKDITVFMKNVMILIVNVCSVENFTLLLHEWVYNDFLTMISVKM